jgi:alpha-maltose-1-phosphate synthase
VKVAASSNSQLSRPRLIISNADNRHPAYQLALAAQEAGLLMRFYTGYYYKDNSLFSKIIKSLPKQITDNIERYLGKRYHEQLNGDYIECDYLHDILYLISILFRRYGLNNLFLEIFKKKTTLFDKNVSNQMVESDWDIFVFFNSIAASFSLQTAKVLGKISVLFTACQDTREWRRIYLEERQLHPKCADLIEDDRYIDYLLPRVVYEFEKADYIIAPSYYVKKSLVSNKIDEKKIYIVPYGAEVEIFYESEKLIFRNSHRKFTILQVGAIQASKGVAYSMKAVKDLAIPEAKLTLVGRLIEKKLLNGYESIITLIPQVPWREITKIYANSDVFVLPTLSEGSAVVTYEAMAAGLPVITTENAGSYVRDGIDGFIVPIRDVEALKAAILKLYEDRELREWMGQNARERARLFTWARYRQNVTNTLIHIFHHGRLPPPIPEYQDCGLMLK